MHRPSKLGLGSNNLSVSAHKNGIDNSFFFFFVIHWQLGLQGFEHGISPLK